MHQAGFLILLLMGVASFVTGSDTKNYFTSPASNTGNPVFALGDELVVSWKTTLDVFNVSIWQQSLVETGASSQGNIFC